MGHLITQALGFASIAVFFGMILLGALQSILMLFDKDPETETTCL